MIDSDIQIDLTLAETGGGIETVTAAGGGYAWTRKQGGILAHGRLMVDGHPREVSGAAIIDDSSGYLPRHTRWRWCAGVGTGTEGQALAWNLVEGVHDSARNSERTVWADGVPAELRDGGARRPLVSGAVHNQNPQRTEDPGRVSHPQVKGEFCDIAPSPAMITSSPKANRSAGGVSMPASATRLGKRSRGSAVK